MKILQIIYYKVLPIITATSCRQTLSLSRCIMPNLDCSYTFPIHSAPNGNPVCLIVNQIWIVITILLFIWHQTEFSIWCRTNRKNVIQIWFDMTRLRTDFSYLKQPSDHTQNNLFKILLNQTEISLYFPISVQFNKISLCIEWYFWPGTTH